MPRQRIHHRRITNVFPDDFPERLTRFQEESGLSWSEIIRRLDIHHETMRRWRKGRARPSMRNMMALVALARPLGLAHLFTGLGSRRSGERLRPQGRKRKKGVTHGRAPPHPHPSTRRCLTGASASS